MILTKKELKEFLTQDAIALKCDNRKHPKIFGDLIWKFQITLRKAEYYSNVYKHKKKYFICRAWYLYKFHKYSIKLNISIPLNVFGPGLSIAHFGTINVNGNAKVGKNCRLHEGVTIGTTNGSDKAPIIGNNVFIGTGAKIIGDIFISDDVAIGANAVVVRSIPEKKGNLCRSSGKKISEKNSHSNLAPKLFL